MRIQDLLALDPALRDHAAKPEMDLFTEDDALREAQVISLSFDAVAGVVAVIFELRTALQLREANTGVLVLHDVRRLSWSGQAPAVDLVAWTVGSSSASPAGDAISLSLVMWPHPGARLDLEAGRGAFFVGDVPGLGEAPPDYSAGTREAVSEFVATWSSEFAPVSAVYLDPRRDW